MGFTDKRVLVRGSSRGIGLAIAEAFVDARARVAINGRTENSVGAAIERLGGGERPVAAPGDIGTVPGCESVVKTANDAFGGLDILVNSAGIGARRPIEDWGGDLGRSRRRQSEGHILLLPCGVTRIAQVQGQYCQHRYGCWLDGATGNDHLLRVRGRGGRQYDPRHGVGSSAGRTG